MSLKSPSFLPGTDPVNDLSALLPPSQLSFSSTIVAHASLRTPSTMRATSSVPNLAFHPSANEQSPARSPMSPGTPSGDPDSPTCQTPDVDQQILEALRSKDRLYVLKLGEAMETLITERRPRVELSPSTSYQRLLVHRCSAYYKLSPESEPGNKGIAVLLTPDSKIPTRRLCELVPAENTAQPAFKIMRRTVQDRFRNKPQSQTGSVAGEEADLSDVEPSESGSVGSRSNATGGSSKKRMTIEEREAAYNEARSRIFMDFDEKEKDKDMNASSSSLGLASGSASTSSGLDDFDDSVSSPATESEWSGSVTREKKDVMRGLGSASSSRSLRSSATPFNTNGSNSSRESRASSPSSFTYASLYEPQSTVPYDTSHVPGQAPGTSYPAQYMYPYPPPGQAAHPPYIAPYPLYVPYPYQPNVLPTTEHPAPPPGNMYSPIHHPGYDHVYGWQHQQPPAVPMPQQSPSQSQQVTNTGPPLSQNAAPFQPAYMPPVPYVPYSVPGYYGPPLPHPEHVRQPLPHMSAPPTMFSGEPPRQMNGNGSNCRGVLTNGSGTGNSSRASSRNSSGSGINGGPKRSVPPTRSGWSYPPVISNSFTYGVNGPMGGLGMCNSGVSDPVVGPRLSSSMRRGSGTSVSSIGNKASPGDEASSNASSSTSSSSRRTYTSTASSQHPLPPRPDWAVGLKPQPTLHTPHPRHHNSPGAEWSGMKSSSILQGSPQSINNSRNVSPGKNGDIILSSHQPGAPQVSPGLLQSTDFPPLTSVTSPPEKRAPTISGGAWNNTSSMRSVLTPNSGYVNSAGNALVHHSGVGGGAGVRVEDQERVFERPSPKGSVELFNPKIVRRPNNVGKSSPQQAEREKDIARGEAVASAILVGQMMTLTLDEPIAADKGGQEPTSMPMPT